MEEQLETSWSKLSVKISTWIDTVILNLPNLLIALILFLLAYFISRSIHSWSHRLLRRFVKQPSVRGLIANSISIGIILLGIILALAILNLDGTLKSILAGAGVAGLAVGLALQGTLSNTFSGIFLALKDELNIGDFVETNGFIGKVVDIDLRNTKVVEPDNNIVVIPNKMIIENPFKNYGLTERIRCTVTCGVAYDSDLEEVKQVAISSIEQIYPPHGDESIEFYFTQFNDSSIDFMIRFWVDAKEKLTALTVKSDAIMAIKKAFDEASIEIPFPIRTLIHNPQVHKDNVLNAS